MICRNLFTRLTTIIFYFEINVIQVFIAICVTTDTKDVWSSLKVVGIAILLVLVVSGMVCLKKKFYRKRGWQKLEKNISFACWWALVVTN